MTYPINEAIDKSVEAMKERLTAPTGWSDELVTSFYGAAAAVAMEVGGAIVVEAVSGGAAQRAVKRVQPMFMAAGVRVAAARLMPFGGPYREADGGPYLAVQQDELEDFTKFLNAVADWFASDRGGGPVTPGSKPVQIREVEPGVWEILVDGVDIAGNVPRDDGGEITFKDGKAHVRINLEPDSFEFEALDAEVIQ